MKFTIIKAIDTDKLNMKIESKVFLDNDLAYGEIELR